jgi:transposase
MKIITLGIDLAKNVFAVHGIDEFGKAVLARPSVRRDQLLELVATLPPCVIGIEACSGARSLFSGASTILPCAPNPGRAARRD